LGDNLTTTVRHIEHLHDRPTWKCRACGQPWPCANAKARLTDEFERFPSVLEIYLTAQMHDAASDLTAHGTDPPPDLYERFLAWVDRDSPT
jgi:hypothetical protein